MQNIGLSIKFLFSIGFTFAMLVKNTTKKSIIAKNAILCKNTLSKTVGLMFSKPKPLIFIFKKEKIIPLHMLFVFYSIDVLFLNKNKVVVETKEALTPFAFYNPKKKAQYIIELPQGAIKKTKTKVGDKIKFQ